MLDRIVDFIIQFLELGRFWVVIHPYEKGVLLRLGTFVRVLESGFHWIIPVGVDHVLYESVVVKAHNLGDFSTTTKDGKQIGFTPILTYKINDIQKALLDVDHVDDAVKAMAAGTIAQALSQCTWQEIVDKPETMDTIALACRKKGWRYGAEIISVQLASFALVKNIRLMGSNHGDTAGLGK